MEYLVEQAWWAPAAIWAALYSSDYILTHLGRRLYGALQGRYIQIESYELNPFWQKTIEAGRWWSTRFAVALTLSTGAVAWAGFLTSGGWETPGQGSRVRMVMSAAVGAGLLLEAVVHMRHVRNVVLFRSLAVANDVEGVLRYPRWLSYQQSSVELGTFAGLFFLIAVIDRSAFCLGGGFATLWTALRHREYGRAALLRPPRSRITMGD
ncbi:MAG: hypothetical protein E6J67_23520 [Deltaproteobacteria bacterium]|nr:MAG: hypothetical protein E6J67_23520 [Deltaproteobacteria bacterium]